ncbi:tRNA pseudouridine(55) synthase TruB [Gemmatimonadota bacterium]
MTESGQNRSGVLLVDKPEGPTSHDVVDQLRRALGVRRVGHTGTLDPFASGLLLLCVGSATRLSEYLVGLEKSYVARATLGVTTTTLDVEGEVVGRDEGWRELTEDRVRDSVKELEGESLQIPPQFSAKKVGGEAMHRKARRGEEVVLEPVPITVHEIVADEVALPELRFRVRCSSGTYIRALARDLGERLGVGCHLTALRRTRIGSFDVERAVSATMIEDEDAWERAWITPEESLSHLNRIEVEAEDAGKLRHGQAVSVVGHDSDSKEPVVVLHGGELLAIGACEGGVVRPRKVFSE